MIPGLLFCKIFIIFLFEILNPEIFSNNYNFKFSKKLSFDELEKNEAIDKKLLRYFKNR